MITKYILPLAAMGLLIFAIVHVSGAQKPEPPSLPLSEPAHVPYRRTVAGAGIIEPKTENIAIGSPVPGLVWKVNVQVGDEIEPRTVLFELDKRNLEADLEVRKAALQSAQAQLEQIKAKRPGEVLVAEFKVSASRANLAEQQDQLARAKRLVAGHVITEEERWRREQAVKMAEAQLSQAEAELALLQNAVWQAELTVAQAAVSQANSQCQQIETELTRLKVLGMNHGRVLQVNVRPGEFVAAPATKALVVVGNVDQLHVRVDIDEHDIPRFRPNSKATAMLRGLPEEKYALSFVRVEPYVIPKKSLTGDNTERVDTRVLQVIYSIDMLGSRLYVGQQMDVFIDAAEPAPASSAPVAAK